MSFFSWFFDIDGDRIEEHVLCPFPHTVQGYEYQESNPSAQVNTEKNVFHCKTCKRGFNEAGFLKELAGMSLVNAHRLLPAFRNTESMHDWDNNESVQHGNIPLANSFNISNDTQSEIKLVSADGLDMRFPVAMYGKLLDVRTYHPESVPKCKSRRGAVNGLILPFDVWVQTPEHKWTILCAGEKDMAVARSMGFNAISITGGEGVLPIIPKYFKNRNVAICYDNDDPGRQGAERVGSYLLKHGANVKVVTAFHEGMEHKEDITDYFNKYNKTKADLIHCIDSTELYEGSEEYFNTPLVNLHQASLPQYTEKMVKANVQVVATSDATFTMPTELIAHKFKASEDPKGNNMYVGETRVWAMDEDNIQDVLHLVDNKFNQKQLNENYRQLTRTPFKERHVSIKSYNSYTVYKAVVTDMYETSSDSDHMPMEYTVYSINHRLESGKKYTAQFKLVPHPYAGQQLVMILWHIDQASDSITSFQLNEDVKTRLKVFKDATEELGVEGMIEDCVDRVKGLLGYNGNNSLIRTMDLAYHTPLTFHMGTFSNIRGYLDTIVVGESRMGKSSTAETLRETYGLGTFVSLAGNSATIPGLVGGSNKVGTGYQTKAGLIPQNHKGLMILEEFGKCKSDVISALTDIRSSNEVRIARVSGALTLPAMVRMITLSNVKTLYSKEIRSIASYPHGLAIITELVGSAEDIARYDIMLVLGDKGTSISDPYWEPQTPYDTDLYRTRVQWIWSRTADQVVIERAVGNYIFEKANQLNVDFDTHIKVFGTEAWKKLARVAIAVAGYCVSTEDYESIVVKEEHVDYADQYMRGIYDNNTFKLRQYVDHERKYSTTDENSVALLTTLFNAAPGAILHLEQEHKTSKAMLAAAAGLGGNDQLNNVINKLIQGMFVKLAGNDIIPTERFRLTCPQIQRTGIVRRVGEINGDTQARTY